MSGRKDLCDRKRYSKRRTGQSVCRGERMNRIPMYLFTGFLGSGKTTFIKNWIIKKAEGKRLLLLLCEDGAVKYPEDFRREYAIVCSRIRNSGDLTKELLSELVTESGAQAVIVEYNGFWSTRRLKQAMPESLFLKDKIFIGNAEDVLIYNRNLSPQLIDKIASSSQAYINRIRPDEPKQVYHDMIRSTSGRCSLFFVNADGRTERDVLPNRAPYNMREKLVLVPPDKFAFFCADLNRLPEAYEGHELQVNGLVVENDDGTTPAAYRIGAETARSVDDVGSFWSIPCVFEGEPPVGKWVQITCTVELPAEPEGEPHLIVKSYSPGFSMEGKPILFI